MKPDKLWYLKNMDIFRSLSDAQYDVIDRDSRSLLLKKRELLDYRSTARRDVYFIKTGALKLVRNSPDGRSLILDILGRGTLFGEFDWQQEGGEDDTVTAEALEETLLCVMRRDNFDRLMHLVPGLSVRVTKLQGLRLLKVRNRLVDLLYSSVECRLARTLLGLGREFGTPTSEGLLIGLRLTHSDLAALIASTRETVTLLVNDLRHRGLIDYRARRLLLADPDLLDRITRHPPEK